MILRAINNKFLTSVRQLMVPVVRPQRLWSRSITAKLITMKIDTPEFKSLFTPELNALIDIFRRHNYEIRIAGGAVRDLLLGLIPHDIDMATVATPTMMKEMYEKEGIRMLNMNGEKHGTITCRINDKENYEVTTLRIDVVTDGRHAEVKFTEDWEEDSRRRDLTINSMFLGFDGTVYDYFNGAADLNDRRVQFVGDATSRIQEDYLRILRYFRFYGRIAPHPNKHEQENLDSIRANRDGLSAISGERIFLELKKIVTGNYAPDILSTMLELGLGAYMGLPEKHNLEELHQVCQRCQTLEPAPITILSSLLETVEQADHMNQRIKMSKEEIRTAHFIIQHRHDDFTSDPLKYCKDLLCETVAKEPKSRERISELLKYCGRKETLDQFTAWEMPKFPVSGHALLELGIPKGPMVSRALMHLKRRWADSGFKDTEQDLLNIADEIKEKFVKKS